MESVFIEVPNSSIGLSKNVIIGVIYRPPGSNISNFNDTFTSILDIIKAEKKFCYLLGDWNINLLNYESHNYTADFIDMLYSYSFAPVINRPTRITASTASIIDNIFTNNQPALINSSQGILMTDITDHFPVFHISNDIIRSPNDVDENTYIVKRSFTDRNKLTFQDELAKIDWNSIYTIENAQEAFSAFHVKLYDIFNKCFPKRRILVKYNNRKPWLTDELKAAIKHKNKLYRLSMKYRTSYNESMYTTHRNKVKHALMAAEKEH